MSKANNVKIRRLLISYNEGTILREIAAYNEVIELKGSTLTCRKEKSSTKTAELTNTQRDELLCRIDSIDFDKWVSDADIERAKDAEACQFFMCEYEDGSMFEYKTKAQPPISFYLIYKSLMRYFGAANTLEKQADNLRSEQEKRSPLLKNKKKPFENELPSFNIDNHDDPLVTIRVDTNPNRVQIGVSSSIGRRSYQQDAAKVESEYAYTDTNKMIAILCDGMGGLSGGEIASNLCANNLYKDFHTVDVSENAAGFLKAAIDKLDRQVSDLKDENQKPLNAGTTLACIIIIDNKMYWASVGDSRIYLIRGNEMAQITVDHNYQLLLDQKVKKGIITKEQAQTHPKREALISYMGMRGVKYIDMNSTPFQLKSGDCILICSDGLYRCLEETEMKNMILNSKKDMTDVANELISKALSKQKKNQDNTTAVLVKYLDFME